jgi:tetratricopeptide (TPR) repeat protein
VTAEQLFLAGLSAYQRGEREAAARYCERAMSSGTLADTLTVQLGHLYLVTTELWWQGDTSPERVSAMVEETARAAKRTGNPALEALAECAYGRYLIASASLRDAVDVFTRASALAKESGNLLAQLESLADLGHHGVGLDMNRGRAVLSEAHALARSAVSAPPADLPLIRVQRARIPGLIGVAAYDAGQFDEAERFLRESIGELTSVHAWDQHAIFVNFLAQLLTETGRFEEAESVLLSALEPLQAHADLTTFQGYNLGLLGKCYLEWGRIDAAAEAVSAGWDRLSLTRHRSILPILRNYLGEVVMHPANPHRDIPRARALFDETIAECERTGFQRSEIGALSLRALADLAADRLPEALAASEQAVTRLAATGTLPALRSEEVYLTRFTVLSCAGAELEAETWLARALATLQAKAASLASPELRARFLSGTPASRQIAAASTSQQNSTEFARQRARQA